MNPASRGAGPLRAVLREPLVHFLIAGSAIFALFGDATSPEDRRIVVDRARIERLAGQFAQGFRRMPSAAELDALIREDIKDEVYYREGVRLGLDRDDVVVKRRLRNKLESGETTADDIPAPDDATLQRWLDAHPARFAGEARFSFDQRYLGDDVAAADEALAALRSGRAFAGLPAPLPATLDRADATQVADQFGADFPALLDKLAIGQWNGPLRSGLGWHLVRLQERAPAPPPRLADIGQRVENDWRAETARERREAAYRTLLERYEIVIEKPK